MAVMVVHDLYLIYAFYDLLQFLKLFFKFIDIVQSMRMNRP